MSLNQDKKNGSAKTGRDGHPKSGGEKSSILGLFGHIHPHEKDVSEGKSPNNAINTSKGANRSHHKGTQKHLRAHKSPSPSGSPGNPHRVSAPISSVSKPGVPGDVQEAYQSATSLHEGKGATDSLSEDELKYLFSGAPHFLLEKGHSSRWYPHVIFPWDDNSRIQNLSDRKALQHPSFTLSTLHAHIPVSPNGAGIQIYPDALTEKHGSRRPSFDIGVFEIPNMLSSRAKEAGCVGFRNFMELPIAYEPKIAARPFPPRPLDAHLQIAPGSRGKDDPYADYRVNVNLDRLKLIAAGPAAWKRIGVRNCSMKAITERLQTLSDMQDQITLQGRSVTLLDKETVVDLHRQLFSTFLYPPPNTVHAEHHDSFRFQISTLMQVLNIKGAWVDFSLTEWRTRAGQILWELPPHQDGDCLDNSAFDGTNPDTSLERKWLLIQLILSAEVLFRADAAAKIGIYSQSKDLPITPRDVYLMNSLRSDALDWGLIFSRRIFENISFHYWPQVPPESSEKLHLKEKHRKTHLIFPGRRIRESQYLGSPWDCTLLPRYPWQQLEALLVFAELLKWPDIENMKHFMHEKLEYALSQPPNHTHILASPISTAPLPDNVKPLGKCEMHRKSHSLKLIHLHSCGSSTLGSANYLGGWMSRTWLTGLVIPGEAICDILMSTLLENDHDAIARLGPIANLYGGFVYKSRSWWSKACVVGRILAGLGTSTLCMGWICTNVIPLDHAGTPLDDGWLEIETINAIKNNTQPRINQGTKVLLDSSPLGGEGDLTAAAFSLPLDEANTGPDQETKVLYENTILSLQRSQDPSILARPRKATASLTFTLTSAHSDSSPISLGINYNVSFIAAFPCLPPHGCIAGSSVSSGSEAHSTHRHRHRRRHHHHHHHHHRNSSGEPLKDHHLGSQENGAARNGKPPHHSRLPGHPLHTFSFPYSYIPIHSLPSTPRPRTIPDHQESHASSFPTNYLPLANDRSRKWEGLQRKHTYIVDARGSEHKELFARSWCAMVGVNAVVGRVGRTCIACSIREARAVDVPIVIRVGAVG
ncbi:hypothetical protein ACJ73_07456 [Blastomyces percursus]|uniref:Uncharacterized protein n=1 Tax=Blastomyces percursus TaxID=1658174 RepID=A0A1J9PXZ2_9EURO|nr:hypothetical protein ACJ73_07456 [Blastomyces percursus]